uniref:NADH-ubiquinone oxidoreductase chain 5 n=1 Tax=Jenufa perforata TaxID=993091 RepID=A0A6G7ITN2_9CHLO|nr:NADH dehydrogenase subunit 5 [Jenufa perforata]QII41624.1 NADH dehydrogenase subunit 5 [Jenufa perforata]
MYLLAVISPFLGSALAGCCGRWLGARGAGVITVLGLFVSFILSLFMFYEVGIQGCSVFVPLNTWYQASTLLVNWTFRFDSLTVCLMLTVSFVSFCVHIYSISYMQTSPHLPRFMSYLSLFTGFMLVLVSGNNLAQMLVGWEGIGVCSYLLIGFWVSRLSATKSAVKAMLVNRVSDTLLVLCLILIWWYCGSLDYDVLWSTTTHAYYVDWICFTLLCASMGKSAQLGFHVWLADAMEGPTPVSALIHAATLVTAGVFLIARTSIFWECSPWCRTLLVLVGGMTSLVAATCGLFQNDLKRVIAYSTCSQLGYMMVSCGLSDYALAIYHLMTHACFKALLFLSAGVIIHAVADVQDVRRHGSAQSRMPFVWSCFLIGSLSLTGWPFLSGFYSKDGILELAFNSQSPVGYWAYLILMVVACFTSFYSFRLLFCSFISETNSRKSESIHIGIDSLMWFPLLILSIGSLFVGYFLFDMLIGWGTDFWHGSIARNPGTAETISSHFLPSSVAWLPLLSVTSGFILAAGYSWWLPIQKTLNNIYVFFVARWQFDEVINQQIVQRVVNFGGSTLRLIDKGVLEWLGPAGLTKTMWSQIVPQVRHWHTGTVHDYALVYKICVLFGLIALVLNFNSFDARSLSVALLLFWLGL